MIKILLFGLFIYFGLKIIGPLFKLFQFQQTIKKKLNKLLLFSNFIYVLNHLNIASSCKFYPVIDMENYTTIYNERQSINKNFNSWNYFFDLKKTFKFSNRCSMSFDAGALPTPVAKRALNQGSAYLRATRV